MADFDELADAADALEVGHQYVGRFELEHAAELIARIDRLAAGDRRVERGGDARLALVVGAGQRLLEPGEVELLEAAAEADGAVDGQRLVGVGH